jgi:hypothetical protein
MRTVDFIAGAAVLPLLGLPLSVLYAFGLRFEVERSLAVGRGARMFWRRRLIFKDGPLADLARRLGLAHLLDGVALLRGDLALIGPRPLPPLAPHAVASYRIAVRPGVLSPFVARAFEHPAYDTEDDADYDYATRRSWNGDLDILMRSLSIWAHGATHPHPPALGASK